MRSAFLISILFSPLVACSQKTSDKIDYPENVGDIAFDKNLDDSAFKICDESHLFQYYNFGKGLQFSGEKTKINEHFKSFENKSLIGVSGYITIRFIVNCEGNTGRFRMAEMDNDYKQKIFPKEITNQILSLQNL